MMVRRLRGPVVILGSIALALALASCGNANSGGGAPTVPKDNGSGGSSATSLPTTGKSPGVTSNSITVGALATESGPLSSGFGEIVNGVEAYFDMVNAQGGVNGRKIYLKYNLDDAATGTSDEAQARNLVEQDHVFAVVGVGSPFFAGSSFFNEEGTPTFGYVVTQNWNNYAGLFGAYGSYLDYNTEEPTAGYIAKAEHAKSAAVLAYNYAPSKEPCADIVTGLQHYGFHVGFQDLNFGIGGTPTADVQQMKQNHVDLVFSCMEGTDNLAFSQAMRQYGMTNVKFVWLNGYSRSLIQANGSTLNGVIFGEQHVPFEAATQFPGKYPGLELYLKTMKKYEPQWVYDDTAIQGWICAAQFVQGLREIGKNVTQNRLIDAINQETDFTAGGLEPPVNWKTAHDSAPPPYCGAYVIDENGKTSVTLAQGTGVYTCVGANSDDLVPDPPGTPGG